MNRNLLIVIPLLLILGIGGVVWYKYIRTSPKPNFTEPIQPAGRDEVAGYLRDIPQGDDVLFPADEAAGNFTQNRTDDAFLPLSEANATTAQGPDEAQQAGQQPEVPEEDSIVRPAFMMDLALLAAAHFHPAGTRDNPSKKPISTLSFRALNMRYGVDLTGLEHQSRDVLKAREEIFDYVLQPVVMRLVYLIYAGKFVDTLTQIGSNQTRAYISGPNTYEERTLRSADTADMLQIYAADLRGAAACLDVYAGRTELEAAYSRYTAAVTRVNKAYARYMDIEAAGGNLERMADEIRDAVKNREALKDKLLASLRGKNAAIQSLDDADVLDIAGWAHRRLKADPGRREGLKTAAQLLSSLARRMEKTAADLAPA
jgi:hypothetical protein